MILLGGFIEMHDRMEKPNERERLSKIGDAAFERNKIKAVYEAPLLEGESGPERKARLKNALRERAQLGGLLVKAGLRGEVSVVLLGGLVELVETLEKTKERSRLAAIGRAAFEIEDE